MMRRMLPALAICLALASPALAGQPVTLKADTLDDDGVVTLGDLFDDSGAAARTPVASKPGATVVLDAGAVQAAARRAGLDWANPTGVRRIIVRGGAPARAVAGNVQVLAYAHALAAGDIVQPADLIWVKAAAAPADAPREPDAVIGMAARRPLAEGAAVSQRDVSAPQVIKAGETIVVTYEDGGVSLTLQGKALANAAVGDSLNVQNPASRKVIEAVAAGPGQAVIGPAAALLKSARNPARYALR